MNPKRKKVEEYILGTLKDMDPGGKNVKRYQKFFNELSDKDFDEWMRNIRDGKEILTYYTPIFGKAVSIADLVKVAKKIDLKLFSRLKIWDSVTESYYLTPHEYLVLRLPIRRMSQFVDHKLSVPEGDSRIDLLTGQVIKPDKAGSLSQVEIQALHARGLDNVILELIKFRGGDVRAFGDFKQELEETGRTSIGKDTGSVARSAVMLQVLLSGAHIGSNVAGVD